MGAWPFYVSDLRDPTAQIRLLDFNSWESGTGRLLVDEDTFSLGGDEFEESWLSAEGVDDAVLASSRRPPARIDFDLHYLKRNSADTAANLQNEIRILNQALDTPGLIVTQPPGYDTLFIDYLRSPLTTPFIPGSRRLSQLFNTLTSPDGLHVVINRLSKMRGAKLPADGNKAHNGTLAEDHDLDGIPSLWAWDSSSGLSVHDFSWAYAAYRYDQAPSTTRLFRQTIAPASPDQWWTFGFEVAANTSGAVATVRARIEFLNVSSAVIGSASTGITPTAITAPSVGFGLAYVTAQAPAATTQIRVSVVSTTTTDANTIYIRKLQAEDNPAPTPFRAGIETVSNDSRLPFFKRIWLWGAGNTDGLLQMTATPASGASVVRMREARRSGFRNSHAAMQTFPGIRAIDGTHKSGSTSVADSEATGGQALQTALSTVYRAVVRVKFPQTDDTALRGRWQLHAAIRAPLLWVGDVQGRYALADVQDMARPMKSVHIDMTEPTVSEYMSYPLGLVDIPADADGLFLELWMRRTSGSGGPLVDVIWPMPADDSTGVTQIPGHDNPGSVATDTWKPVDFVTPPAHPTGLAAGALSAQGDSMVLDNTNESAGIPEAATDALTAGVAHTFTAEGVLDNPGLTALIHGELRVWDITAGVQVTKVSIAAAAGASQPAFTVAVTFTPVTGHTYSIYVRNNVATAQGAIRLKRMTHSFVPAVTGGTEGLVLDGVLRQAYVAAAGLRTTDLDHIPPFPALKPGLQLYRISTADTPGAGYDTVSGVDLAKHVPGVTVDVAADQVPRFSN